MFFGYVHLMPKRTKSTCSCSSQMLASMAIINVVFLPLNSVCVLQRSCLTDHWRNCERTFERKRWSNRKRSGYRRFLRFGGFDCGLNRVIQLLRPIESICYRKICLKRLLRHIFVKYLLLFSATAAFLNSVTASFAISSMISISFPEKESEAPDSSDESVEKGNEVPRPISVPSYT